MTSPVFSQIQHAWAKGSKGCKFGVEAGNVGVGVDNDDVVEVVKVEDKVEVEQELLEAELEAAAAASAAALAANAKAPFGSFLMFEVSNVWENNGLSKKHWDEENKSKCQCFSLLVVFWTNKSAAFSGRLSKKIETTRTTSTFAWPRDSRPSNSEGRVHLILSKFQLSASSFIYVQLFEW